MSELKKCLVCPKMFLVSGRGNPKESQDCCSKSCSNRKQCLQKYGNTLWNKEWMEAKYNTEGLSLSEIGILAGNATATVVSRALKQLGVERRSISEGRVKLFDRRGRREVTQAEVIEAYGGRCECPGCDVTEPAFLTIDHVGGGGNKHRRSLGGNQVRRLRRWLKDQGWPRDGFRLLCMNCNHATRHGKTCPHLLKEA